MNHLPNPTWLRKSCSGSLNGILTVNQFGAIPNPNHASMEWQNEQKYSIDL